MKKIKAWCVEVIAKNKKVSIIVLNISSVICPNELITRPFVFRETNAKPCFWLMPHEVAEEVDRLTADDSQGFYEYELFHPAKYYQTGYFMDTNFTVRKKESWVFRRKNPNKVDLKIVSPWLGEMLPA